MGEVVGDDYIPGMKLSNRFDLAGGESFYSLHDDGVYCSWQNTEDEYVVIVSHDRSN